MLDQGGHDRTVDGGGAEVLRLDGEHVFAPPRAGSPPGPTQPDIAVGLDVRKHVVDRLVAHSRADGRIRHGEFAQKPAFVVVFAPLRKPGEPGRPDGRVHDCRRCPGGVGIQVLMDLKCIVVQRVDHAQHGGPVGRAVPVVFPTVGAGISVAGHQNQVGGAGLADGRDGGIGRGQPILRGHVRRLVHQAEDDAVIGPIGGGEPPPEICEGGVGDIVAEQAGGGGLVGRGGIRVIPRKVVRIQNDDHAFGRRLAYESIKPAEFRRIEIGECASLQPLPPKAQPEAIHPLALEVIDLLLIWIDIVSIVDAGKAGLTEFGPREVDARQEGLLRPACACDGRRKEGRRQDSGPRGSECSHGRDVRGGALIRVIDGEPAVCVILQ